MNTQIKKFEGQTLYLGQDAKAILIEGVNKLADAVCSTLGPGGLNIVIEDTMGNPSVTKDGVTVAKSIHLKAPYNMGAYLVKRAAERLAEQCGDGPQPLWASILTPNGFIYMRDAEKGMDIVGSNQTIQQIVDVYPKGEKEIVKIEFSSQQVVECCEDHLFTVTTNYGAKKTITAKQMLVDFKQQTKDGNYKYKYFVKTEPIELGETLRPLDSYLLGVLLGDGSLTGTGSVEISLGKKKEHIINKLVLPEGITANSIYYEKKNYFRVKLSGHTPEGKSMLDILKELNLNVGSKDKFIPDCYLGGSIFSREQLLQGLIDTDGHINKKGLIEFSTVSKVLASNFWQLMISLGRSIKVHLHSRENDPNSYSDTSIYRLTERKGYKYGHKIIDIIKTGEKTEMQCIKVSNDDNLYITDGFIFTHNTSTVTAMTQRIVTEGFNIIKEKKINPKVLFFQMKRAHTQVQELLKSQIIPEGEYNIQDIAYTSSNGDTEMTELIVEAFETTGRDGLILVDDSRSIHSSLSKTNGFLYDKGYISSQFNLNKESTSIILDNCKVLIYDKKIERLEHIKDVLLKVAKNEESIMIIAEDFDPQVLSMLIINVRQYGLKVVAVKAPSYGENRYHNLEDIAALTGGTLISQNNGLTLSEIRYEDLGTSESIKITPESFLLINPNIDEARHQTQLRHAQSQTENIQLTKWEIDQAKARLARLRNKVVTILVGGMTDIDVKEKKDRYDDAIKALFVAIKNGIVAGGGIALLRSRIQENEGDYGATIINKAIYEPFKRILYNSGFTTKETLNALKSNKYYNIDNDTIKYTDDLRSTRCIDPYLVTSESLKTALNISGSILLNEGIVLQDLKFETDIEE